MRKHVRIRWPDLPVPAGEPTWLLYEIDEGADAVVRSVDIYADGTIARNSIEIEERSGQRCPSLIGTSVADAFAGVATEEITQEAFDAAWQSGLDRPFWNVR